MSISEIKQPIVPQEGAESLWPELRRQVGGLRYGSVEISVEDAQIVRVELSVRSRAARGDRDRKFRSK